MAHGRGVISSPWSNLSGYFRIYNSDNERDATMLNRRFQDYDFYGFYERSKMYEYLNVFIKVGTCLLRTLASLIDKLRVAIKRLTNNRFVRRLDALGCRHATMKVSSALKHFHA